MPSHFLLRRKSTSTFQCSLRQLGAHIGQPGSNNLERTARTRHGDPPVPTLPPLNLPLLPPPPHHLNPAPTLHHPIHPRTARREPLRRSPTRRASILPTSTLPPQDRSNTLPLRRTHPPPQRPRLAKPARHRRHRAHRSGLETLLRRHALRQPPPARLRHEAQHAHHFIKAEPGALTLFIRGTNRVPEEPAGRVRRRVPAEFVRDG